MLPYFTEITAFFIGMCIGSFLNVCIYRLPRSESIISPRRSFCPTCKTAIAYYDNIPTISFLLLKGRCRHCHGAISIRYPLVELMAGLFAVCTTAKFGLTTESLIYYAFIAALMVITYIDIDHQIIPDAITLPGIPVFFLASLALPTVKLTDSILGVLLGGGSLWLIAAGYQTLKKQEGMGGGDIKLLAMIGALVGWKGVLFTIFFSSALGTVSGLMLMVREQKGMKLAIPFGPFLSLGAITYLFLGPPLVNWYLNLLR